MQRLSKKYEIAYGHRIMTQKLDEQWTSNTVCKCKRIHGHNAKITLNLKTAKDPETEHYAIDFNHFEPFKKILENLDHKYIVFYKDYEFWNMFKVGPSIIEYFEKHNFEPLNFKQYREVQKPPVLEFLASENLLFDFYIVNFVPTSENLAAYLHKKAYKIFSKLPAFFDIEIKFSETGSSEVLFC